MITVADVAAAVPQAQVLSNAGGTRFTRASIDTRTAAAGELFVAIVGESRDGHDFVDAARAAGVRGFLVSDLAAAQRLVDRGDTTVLLVAHTLAALQQAARVRRERSEATVIAVTGSAGKTTAKTMIAQALSHLSVLANPASFNNHLGVPLNLSSMADEPLVVAEIGTNNPGEIAHLTSLVQPDIAVITTIGLAHIGNFGGQQQIAAEKTDLLRGTRPGGTWVVNGDDLLLRAQVAAMAEPRTAVWYGLGPDNDIRAVDVQVTETGTRGRLVGAAVGEGLDFDVPAPGRHFAYAVALAVAVAQAAGVEPQQALANLRAVQLPPGRASVSRASDDLLLIDDSYNGSPDAMLSSLDLLAALPGQTKVAVLGAMGELGEFSAELHRRVGNVAGGQATHLVTVGADAEPLRQAAIATGVSAERTWSVDSALAALQMVQELLQSSSGQSVVLVKGSRFRHMERVALGLQGTGVTCPKDVCHRYIACSTCAELN